MQNGEAQTVRAQFEDGFKAAASAIGKTASLLSGSVKSAVGTLHECILRSLPIPSAGKKVVQDTEASAIVIHFENGAITARAADGGDAAACTRTVKGTIGAHDQRTLRILRVDRRIRAKNIEVGVAIAIGADFEDGTVNAAATHGIIGSSIEHAITGLDNAAHGAIRVEAIEIMDDGVTGAVRFDAED